MIAAREPRSREAARLLVIDSAAGAYRDALASDLSKYFDAGDLLVLNDAATLPASFRVRMPSGAEGEVRLINWIADATWNVVLFGSGDWRTPTELRDPPEEVRVGDVIQVTDSFVMNVVEISSVSRRLVTVRFNRSGSELWTALYAHGRPIQYSYLSHDLALWSVQTAYAGRPWAVEMPSAGYFLTWQSIRELRQKGVVLTSLTHAAGLSSTGDEELDAVLPLPERFDIPEVTVAAVEAARRNGHRIVAVGTTVVRALEGSAQRNNGVLTGGAGVTDLVIDSKFHPGVVSGILTGIHDPSQSHFRLLRALANEATLRRAIRHATEFNYLGHEFGDSCLILGSIQ